MDYINNVELKIVKCDYAKGRFQKKPWDYPKCPAPSEIKGNEAIYRGMNDIYSLFIYMQGKENPNNDSYREPCWNILEENLKYKYFKQGIPDKAYLLFDPKEKKFKVDPHDVFQKRFQDDFFTIGILHPFTNYSITLYFKDAEKTFDISKNEIINDNRIKTIIIPETVVDELSLNNKEVNLETMIIVKGINNQ